MVINMTSSIEIVVSKIFWILGADDGSVRANASLPWFHFLQRLESAPIHGG